MKRNPLYVAFLWHMHQPYYGNKTSLRSSLPWVRLHGIKDYYPMGLICEKFPAIRQNFNFTPCLLEQIANYASGTASDPFRDLTAKPASALSKEDKDFILSSFFFSNWDKMVKKFPRYEDLLFKRGAYEAYPRSAIDRFSVQDFLDLQILFNLSWFHSFTIEGDEELKKLKERGENFSEKDKELILRKEMETLSSIIPLYKKLKAKQQIEITTSPYYHPILPLLCDTEAAKVAMPYLNLPFRFSHPEDAEIQIRKAIDYHTSVFGSTPAGMWPSEGSVSEDIIPIAARAGIKWIATDEDILSLSGEAFQPWSRYQPYRLNVKGEEIGILFRDRTLSDRIGFVYQNWLPGDGAKDLILRLKKIREEVSNSPGEHLVSIILDGENPWEYYPDNGREFLFALFEELSKTPEIETVTVSQYLGKHPPGKTLTRLFPGSWINHDFYIWIGHDEDRKAWDLLRRTREVLVQCEAAGNCDRDKLASAWEELYIAEGSDWCWWYGTDHSSALDEEFDSLYREHLGNVYRFLGQEVPGDILLPIGSREKIEPEKKPVGFIHPLIDGKVSNYYEWEPAGIYGTGAVGGTMQRGHSILERIYYGFDLKNIYLRLDPRADFKKMPEPKLIIEMFLPEPVRIELSPLQHQKEGEVSVYTQDEERKWTKRETEVMLAFGQIIELAFPIVEVNAKQGDEVSLIISIWSKENEVERWPKQGKIAFTVPDADYELRQWYV